jgi:NitT/TauT family transport system substrate-binding protein
MSVRSQSSQREAPSVGELVTATLAGDKRAWERLVLQLRPWAVAAARQRLAAKHLSEDAVQEAFCIAHNKLKSLRDPDAFPAWLASIIQSRCSRLAASEHGGQSLELLDELGRLPPMDYGDPADSLHERRLRLALEKAARELPLHLRDIARDYYVCGLTALEISFKHKLLEGTVKKRLHASRGLLAVALAPYKGEKSLRVGFMPISDHLLGMVAQRLDGRRGGPFSLKRFLSWSSLADALRRGQIDAAFIMAPLAMRLANDGVELLHILDAHHDGSSLSSAQNGGLQRLALPAAFSTHALLLSRLIEGQPARRPFSTKVVSPSHMLASMRAHEIDSFFCAEPWGLKCSREKLGQTLVLSKDILPGHTCCILAVRKELAATHAELLAAYVRRLLKARDRVSADPGFGALVQSACTGVDKDIAQDVLERRIVTFDDLAPCKERLKVFLPLLAPDGTAGFDLDLFLSADFIQ